MHDEALATYLDECRALVARHVFMVNVCAQAPLPYAYTIGLTPLMGFELVTVGSDFDTSRIVLNETAHRLLSDESIQDGERLKGEASTDLRLAPLALMWHVAFLVHLLPRLEYYPQSLRQVFVADAQGRFPGDRGYVGPLQDIDGCVHRKRLQLS